MWSRVTLPSSSKSRRRAGSRAAASARGERAPRPPATAISARKSRRVTSTATAPAPADGPAARALAPRSVADPRHADGLAHVERREVELELRVLDGIGGEHVRTERRHAPLHALARVPDVALARAPGREMPREPRDRKSVV